MQRTMELTTHIVSYDDFGRIKKKEYTTKELMERARKCSNKDQFAFWLMNLTPKEIERGLEQATNPNGLTVIDAGTETALACLTIKGPYEEFVEAVKGRYPGRDLKLVKQKVNYYKKRQYEGLKKEYESLLEFYDNLGVFNFYTPIQELWEGKNEWLMERYPIYSLYKKMSEELGIIGYKEERDYDRMDNTWYRSLGLQGNGIEFVTPEGKSIYLYMDIQDYNHLYISQFAIKERGEGLGTKVMELLKEFMVDIKGHITVMKVCNQKYFDRFDWLVPTECKSFYEFNSNKQEKAA